MYCVSIFLGVSSGTGGGRFGSQLLLSDLRVIFLPHFCESSHITMNILATNFCEYYLSRVLHSLAIGGEVIKNPVLREKVSNRYSVLSISPIEVCEGQL